MRGIVLAAALFFAPGIWAQFYDDADALSFVRYSYKFEGRRISQRGVFSVPVPGISEIERDRGKFSSYPEFLDYLFSAAPSLAHHHVLLHHSASLQLASFEFPRVIVFDGGKAFAFSEHPENRAIKVEMMEVSADDYSLELAEISFPATGGVKVKRNPKACLACHGSPAKMLWDPYDFWPNAFGSAVGAMMGQPESDAYQRLRARASESPVLQRLRLREHLELTKEENTPFTQYVGQINLAGQLGRLLKGQDLSGWRFPLLSAVTACHSTMNTDFAHARRSFLELLQPEETKEMATRLDKVHSDLAIARRHMKVTHTGLMSRYFNDPQLPLRMDHERLVGEVTDLALVRTVIDAAGLNLNNLSTSHLGNDFFISNPSNWLLDFTAVLYEVRPDLFAGIAIRPELLGTQHPGWITLDCAELREKSRREKRPAPAPSQWRSHEAVKYERPAINRCVKCHAEGLDAEAPYLPFDDSVTLARWLRDPNKKLAARIQNRIERRDDRQMPPGRPLSREEIDSLKEMIEALR